VAVAAAVAAVPSRVVVAARASGSTAARV